ncbi:MAG: peptidase [Methylocystis sp.]|nr:MAG: peptidase [Methylocystis sp.]
MSSQLPVLFEPELLGSDLEALRAAVDALERQSFAGRLARMAGRKIGFVSGPLPAQLQAAASAATHKALNTALNVALTSLEGAPQGDSTRLHKRLAALAGGVGGAVGLASLPLELPVSTTIMLRSIADIARNEGENLRNPETGLACLEVFALGGHPDDKVLEGGYLAVRGLLAKSVTDAARFITARGVLQEGAPVIVRLVSQVATRFGVVVSQKAAAQAVPLIGAVSGAAINVAFTDHFQTLARGHFAVRRLERVYDPAMVRRHYARIAREEGYWDPPVSA